MKRDLDLTRNLLFAIEEWTPKDDFDEVLLRFGIDSTESEELDCSIRYHIHILRGAGYVEASSADLTFCDSCEYPNFWAPSLTWHGQEFLDSIRPQPVYQKVQERVKGLGSVSFEVIKALAVEVAKNQLGLTP